MPIREGMKHCDFCDRPENEVKKMVAREGKFICNKCVSEVTQALGSAPAEEKPNKKAEVPVRPPKEIKAFFDQHVISQDRAKTDIAVAVYNHFKRRDALKKGYMPSDEALAGVEIQKSNILLLGPSGTGKTELARAVARMLKVPFYIADATKMTQAGYVGDDVESMLQGLIADANGDIPRAEWGVIFIDEIDKLARKSGRGATGYRDVSGEGVQQSLLKLIEGSKVNVPRGGLKVDAGQGADQIDTTNILFIGAGSFAGIDETITRRVNKKAAVGFGAEARQVLTSKEVYDLFKEDDVLDFGLIPELLGRLPVLTTTQPLSEEDLVRILTEPKHALVKQFRALFAMDGIDLQFDPEALKAIGREANKRPTGARALRSIIEDLLRPYSYEYRGNPEVKVIRVTPEMVEGKGEALVTTEAGKQLKLKVATG